MTIFPFLSMTSSYKEVRAKRSQIPVNLKEGHDDNKVLSEQEKRWKTRQVNIIFFLNSLIRNCIKYKKNNKTYKAYRNNKI